MSVSLKSARSLKFEGSRIENPTLAGNGMFSREFYSVQFTVNRLPFTIYPLTFDFESACEAFKFRLIHSVRHCVGWKAG